MAPRRPPTAPDVTQRSEHDCAACGLAIPEYERRGLLLIPIEPTEGHHGSTAAYAVHTACAHELHSAMAAMRD